MFERFSLDVSVFVGCSLDYLSTCGGFPLDPLMDFLWIFVGLSLVFAGCSLDDRWTFAGIIIVTV